MKAWFVQPSKTNTKNYTRCPEVYHGKGIELSQSFSYFYFKLHYDYQTKCMDSELKHQSTQQKKEELFQLKDKAGGGTYMNCSWVISKWKSREEIRSLRVPHKSSRSTSEDTHVTC